MNNSDTTQPIDRPVNTFDFAHLAWLAVGTALVSALLYALIGASHDNELAAIAGCIIFCSALATVFVGSAWAVFGPGSYLKRLFWSHLLCVVVGLGHLAGLIMLAWDIGTGSDIFWEPIKYFIIGIAPVSLAAQLPFWFFRFFFGWQFTYGLSPPAESFSLRDIFVFTFVAALGFAGPQMAINLASKPDWFDPTTTYEQVTQPDGTVEWEEVVLTDQKIIDEKNRDFERQNRLGILFWYAAAGVWSFGISLLSLPIPLLIFRTNDRGAGCGLTAAYAFGWLILAAAIVGLWLPGPPGEILGYLWGGLLSYVGLVSIVFGFSRSQGFRLSSPRRFSRQTKKINETLDR